jgi:hypothetical protein
MTRQPHSTHPSGFDEAEELMLERTRELAEHSLREAGVVIPLFLCLARDGHLIALPVEQFFAGDDDRKEMLVEFGREVVRVEGGVMTALIVEAWTVDHATADDAERALLSSSDLMPSESRYRIDTVAVTIQTHERLAIATIEILEEGGVRRLGRLLTKGSAAAASEDGSVQTRFDFFPLAPHDGPHLQA